MTFAVSHSSPALVEQVGLIKINANICDNQLEKKKKEKRKFGEGYMHLKKYSNMINNSGKKKKKSFSFYSELKPLVMNIALLIDLIAKNLH